MNSTKKSDLESINFGNLVQPYFRFRKDEDLEAANFELADFVDKKHLKFKEWLIPQALAAFAELSLETNETGLISSKKLYSEIRKSETLTGLWLLFRFADRSLLVERQNSGDSRNFCALVPLIMSAFKKFHNVKYSSWDPEEISTITHQDLADAMLVKVPFISRDDLIEARNYGLVIKSGKDAGKTRDATKQYAFYPPKNSEVGYLPKLAKIMLCQTWCAHPVNRTKYMVLDPNNWDAMPEPLVSDDILLEEKKPVSKKKSTQPVNDISWDL